jgi:uncharacterized protein
MAYCTAFAYICNMSNFTIVKDALKSLKPLLESKYNVKSLGLFGSIVRSDFSPSKSDIDILVEFSKPIGIEFIDLADLIEKHVNRKIDLVSKNGIKRKYLMDIENEIVYV